MADAHVTPEELQKAVLKWTALGAAGFIGAVIAYVYLAILN
jgi:hypothetical protein